MMLSSFFLPFCLFWQLVELCVPQRTLDQVGNWWYHYCFMFPLGNSRCLQWHSEPWEHMISLPLGKVSFPSVFSFLSLVGSEERTRERGIFFSFFYVVLFNLLTVHLRYWWPQSSCPWLFLSIILGHIDFLCLRLLSRLHTAQEYLELICIN